MEQKAKTFFYGILAVFTFSLVLGACPPEPEPKPSKPADIPSVNGTSGLKLSGQVYIQNTDPTDLILNLSNAIYKGNLNISDGGLGGIGQIKNGQLDYTIDKEPPLSPINEDGSLAYLKERYKSLKFSSEDVNAAAVAFEIINDEENSGLEEEEYSGLLKGSLNINLDLYKLTVIITIKMVNYVYVDGDVTITAAPDTFEYDTDYGFPIKLTTEKINLNLKKGWNSLYEEITAQSNIPPELMFPQDEDSSEPTDLTSLKPTGNLRMSVADPGNLNWTLIPSQSLDDIESQYPGYPEP
jgi:hypothetical protein